MHQEQNSKPVALWLDDSVAQEFTIRDYLVRHIEEEADDQFEVKLFGDIDEAIEFVIRNAHRVFMFIQDSTRFNPGKIIPAWKKLRPTRSPDIGFRSHQGDSCTYVVDAFTPIAGAVFAGFSFGKDERDLITSWGKRDPRILLADKMRLSFGDRSTGEESGFKRIGLTQLHRWQQLDTNPPRSTESIIVAPLAEELAALCGARHQLLDRLTPRQFEELIAGLFRNHGFDVHLTACTRDGGYDIVAATHTSLSRETILIEVKHFAPNRPVGVGVVRALYGVTKLRDASRGILATSSYVSRDAKREFSRVIPWEIDLVEREQILEWCTKYLTELLTDEEDTEQGDPNRPADAVD